MAVRLMIVKWPLFWRQNSITITVISFVTENENYSFTVDCGGILRIDGASETIIQVFYIVSGVYFMK